MPTYKGDAWLGDALGSLARQSLSYDQFEVVLVPNGPPANVETIVEKVRNMFPGLDVRMVYSDKPGASRARNVGLEAARGRYITFVDDDDQVGPRYLASMLSRAGADRIVVARLATVDNGDTTRPNLDSYMADYFDPWVGENPTSVDLAQHLHSAVAKLAPVEFARTAQFDEKLSYGEDAVYWMSVVGSTDALLVLGDEDPEATYIYCRRPDSLAAFGLLNDWKKQVPRRFDVVAALESVDVKTEEHRAIRAVLEERQYRQAGDYYERNPAERARFDAELESRHFSGVPWQRVHPPAARVLSVVDTDNRDSRGLFAHHRLRRREERTDVVFYASEGGASAIALSRSLQVIAGQYGAGGPGAVTWDIVSGFVGFASRTMRELDPQENRYTALYSAGPSPMDHLAAAVLKAARPRLRWTVEEVTPVLGATPRGVGVASEAGSLYDILRGALSAKGAAPLPVGAPVEAWAETLIRVLADEVVARKDPPPRNSREDDVPIASVVVATTGAENLDRTIGSLEAQTLPFADFEVVVQARSTLEESRQAGRSAARASHVTVIDAGDLVGRRFLEALVENMRDRAITAVPVVELREADGTLDPNTPSVHTALRFLGLPHSQDDLAPMVALPWGHLDPVAPPGPTWVQIAETSMETAYYRAVS